MSKRRVLDRFVVGLCVVSFCSVPALAQDVLHYRFDGGCGSEVIQFGEGAGAASIDTGLAGGPDAARVPGRFGGGLAGSPAGAAATWLRTGWAPDSPSGDFTVAMWLRNRPGNPTVLPFGYLFGATSGQLRMYIGSTGRLWLDGLPGVAVASTDLTPLLNAGWVHVACVVDSGSLEATFYVNGLPELAVSIGVGAWLMGTDFTIGARDGAGTAPAALDIDEFLWHEGLLNVTQIQSLVASPRAGTGAYTLGAAQACAGPAISLAPTGGRPTIGNQVFGVEVTTANQALVVFAAGFDRCSFGTAPLPIDAGALLPQLAGCAIVVEPITTASGVGGASPVTFPLPIPASLTIAPSVYVQALSIDTTTLQPSLSDGFAVAVGR